MENIEKYIEIARKQESELTDKDKEILKSIEDGNMMKAFITINPYFIKYLNKPNYKVSEYGIYFYSAFLKNKNLNSILKYYGITYEDFVFLSFNQELLKQKFKDEEAFLNFNYNLSEQVYSSLGLNKNVISKNMDDAVKNLDDETIVYISLSTENIENIKKRAGTLKKLSLMKQSADKTIVK